MTFKTRSIEASFKLTNGLFGKSLNDTVRFSGLRCEASINSVSGASLNSLQLRVYGMSDAVMNENIDTWNKYCH